VGHPLVILVKMSQAFIFVLAMLHQERNVVSWKWVTACGYSKMSCVAFPWTVPLCVGPGSQEREGKDRARKVPEDIA
jgi:hypothetical protein